MFDFHEKRKLRSWLYSKFSIGVLLILSLALSVSVYERFKIEREMAVKLEDKRQQLEVLEERAAALESDVSYLNDERGIEEELRERFDVVREGEQVVVIVDDESSETEDLDVLSRPPGASVEEESSSWFDFLIFW